MSFLNRLASEAELKRNKSIIMKTFHGYSIFTEILDMPSEVFNDNFDNTKVAVVIVRIEI